MDTPIPDEKLAAIKEAIFAGETIRAIKLHREATHSGLSEAKQAVEKLQAELRASFPEKFATTPTRSGCFSVVVVLTVIVIGIIWWTIAR